MNLVSSIPRCPACPGLRPRVLPDGPLTPTRIALLGEAPSTAEDKAGKVFVGKTGVELTETYLPIAGLYRSQLWIYNAFCCSKEDYDNPTPLEAMTCASVYLGEYLRAVKPQIIVVMGAIACSLFPEVGNLNLQHGKPLPGKWGMWEGVLFPTYHPSAGIHQTGYMISLMQDFATLGDLQRKLEPYWEY